MSFYGSFDNAKNANGVEEGGPTERNMPTSPVRDGGNSPGGAAAGTKVDMVHEVRRQIKPRTKTSTLRRRYPSDF